MVGASEGLPLQDVNQVSGTNLPRNKLWLFSFTLMTCSGVREGTNPGLCHHDSTEAARNPGRSEEVDFKGVLVHYK